MDKVELAVQIILTILEGVSKVLGVSVDDIKVKLAEDPTIKSRASDDVLRLIQETLKSRQ